MQKIIVANFLKMNFLIILLMILVNCGDNNVEKNKIPITDNEGSFIIRCPVSPRYGCPISKV